MSGEIKTRLELIAAKAKTLANDLGRMYSEELKEGASDLQRQCARLVDDIREGKRS